MRCLTLTQPYASLIAIGAKTIETRSWSTSYRGPLAIHAAKGLGPVGGEDGLMDLLKTEPFKSALGDLIRTGDRANGSPWAKPDWITNARLPFGAIVAVCELKDCRPTAGRRGEQGTGPKYADWVHDLTDQERAFGDYSPGRYAWLLSDIRALPEPIPARGAQGLWAWAGAVPVFS